MEKTKKANSIRKLLTLMLAFVMVFTGMGIGSLGVDQAWADDGTIDITSTTQLTKIDDAKITVDGTEYDVYKLDADISTCNLVKFSAVGKMAINNVLPIVGQKPPTNLVNVHPKTYTDNYNLGKQHFESISANLSDTIKNKLNSDAEKTSFYIYCASGWGKNLKTKTIFGILIIEWTGADASVDKTKLAEVIASAPTDEDTSYYHEGDRYNLQKKVSSQNGFWSDMQTALQTAVKINEDANALQNQVDKAKSDLETAIANLIPTSQINPTTLYEAIHAPLRVSSAGGYEYTNKTLEDCTAVTAAVYQEALDNAQDYLDSLFDEAGEATATNDSKNTESVNTYNARVQALTDAMAGLALQSEYDSCRTYYYNQREDALALLEQYAPKKLQEEDYTPESWTTYLSAFKVS